MSSSSIQLVLHIRRLIWFPKKEESLERWKEDELEYDFAPTRSHQQLIDLKGK